jgi:hypothetical protein
MMEIFPDFLKSEHLDVIEKYRLLYSNLYKNFLSQLYSKNDSLVIFDYDQ